MACGRLGDIFGHGNILLLGMTLFNAATLLCALINNQVGLVIGRAVQGTSVYKLLSVLFLHTNSSYRYPLLGLGAAFTIPPAQSMVSLLFQDPSARIKAFAAWGACGSTGFVCVFHIYRARGGTSLTCVVSGQLSADFSPRSCPGTGYNTLSINPLLYLNVTWPTDMNYTDILDQFNMRRRLGNRSIGASF